jgi:hypothetical protein
MYAEANFFGLVPAASYWDARTARKEVSNSERTYCCTVRVSTDDLRLLVGPEPGTAPVRPGIRIAVSLSSGFRMGQYGLRYSMITARQLVKALPL